MTDETTKSEARKAAWAEGLAEILLAIIFFGGAWLLLQRWSWMLFLALGLFLMLGLPAIFLLSEHRKSRKAR